MALTIGELVGYLKLDDKEWTSKQRKAKQDLKDLGDEWGKVGSKADTAAMSFMRSANSLSNIPTIIQVVAGVGEQLGTMSGALGVVPGVAAAAAAGMVAVKLGVQGFGDAMKNAGDPAKFAESLKSLAPAAQETAIAVRDLRGEWSGMQKSVQQQLFAGLSTQVKALGHNYIPVLSQGLAGVAAGLNLGTQQTAAYLNRSTQVQTVAGIFANVKTATDEVGKSMSPLVQIILDITSVSAQFLPGLSGGLSHAAEAAADFVNNARETGKLHDWISAGLSALGDLWHLLTNIGGIVKTVFDAFDTAGTPVLAKLINITGAVRDFLRSVEGQAALHALADALNAVSGAVTDVMLTGIKELAPIVVAAAPGFAELARQVGDVLVGAMKVVGPMLAGMAKFLSDNVDWLGPLAIGLYGAVKAIQAVIVVMKLLTIVSAINPWVIIIAATIALVTLIVTHWDEIKAAVSAALKWIGDLVSSVWNWIKTTIIDNIVGAAQAVGDFFATIGQWFADLPGRVGSFLASLPGILWDAFTNALQWALNAVIQGIEWIIALVIAIPLRFVLALADLGVMLWNALVAAWEWAKNAVVQGVDAIVDFVIKLPGRIVDGIVALGGMLAQWATDAWTWCKNAVVTGVDAVVNFVINLPSRIIQGIGALGSMLGGWARDAWNTCRDGVVAGVQAVIDFVTGLPGKILGALGDLGHLLWDAGKKIITGLLDGIKAAINAVWDFISGIGSKISSLKGPLPKDLVLLTPAGKAIMQGLLDGMHDQESTLWSYVAGLTTRIGSTSLSMAVAGTAPSGATPFAGAGDQRALVSIGTFNATPTQSPHDIASELDWATRGAGY